ncbi:MAG: hypothetical protein ACI9HY_003964, partial [Planctomycetaceae bacterium]
LTPPHPISAAIKPNTFFKNPLHSTHQNNPD